MRGRIVFAAVDEFRKSYGFLIRESIARLKHMAVRIRWYGLSRSHVKLPGKVRNVLFLCKGNICRSPLAEVYFRSKLKPECGIMVRSAGLDTTNGKPAHNFARQVAEQYGLTLEPHLTMQMVREMVEEADLILVMEFAQLVGLVKLCPRVKSKVFVLGEFMNGKRIDIADPFSGTIEDFKKCFRVIRASCDSLAEKINT
jgi:protein-tyrosine phosphatase